MACNQIMTVNTTDSRSQQQSGIENQPCCPMSTGTYECPGVHLVTGDRNVSAIFRASFTTERWVVCILENSVGYMQKELAKFIEDEPGVASQPRKGASVNVPSETRIWCAMHRISNESQ